MVERLLAVQGQDPRGARLAVRARTEGLAAADVDRALTEERSLLITWLNRGTLHLVRSEDYPWLHALTTPPLSTGNARRLQQEGVSPTRGRAGGGDDRAGAGRGGAAHAGAAPRAARRGRRAHRRARRWSTCCCWPPAGLAVRGPMVASEQAYVLVRDWLGEQQPVDRDVALAELARRYLVGHGPAGEPRPRPVGGAAAARRTGRPGRRSPASSSSARTAWSTWSAARQPPGCRRPACSAPSTRVLLGWTSRELMLGPHTGVVTLNGIFRPFALVGGRAVATWSMPRGEVVLAPFGRLARKHAAALEADAADVVRFLTPVEIR